MKLQLLIWLLRHIPSLRAPLVDYLSASSLEYRISQIPELSDKLGVVYDIGANRGDWTRMAQRWLPASKFFLFEANEAHKTSLQSLQQFFHIGVLSDRTRDVEFFGDGGTGDSYFRENTVHYEAVTPRVVEARALDDVIQEKNLPMPDFIKLDTQGAELDILRGAEKALSHATLVYLECPFLAYNVGAPKFQDYIDYFDEHGFYPIDICEKHYFAGALVQGDFLFARKSMVPARKRLKPASHSVVTAQLS
jgi:FkbM family methyltransferase